MSKQDVDALFRRFSDRGDTAALGQVFDSTWEELFRIALHFVERPDEAEDLVQATWITAIENARERDAERRLMPWLIGILALHAREMRRERRRELDPRRVEVRDAPSADARAESIELATAVRGALSTVPETYRETLRRFLIEGHKALEIALETGQRPATVRMQLHRGLEHLRKALPAGLALGGAAILVPSRGMAAVRESVLASGAQAAASLGSATTSSLIVGTLTMKKLIAAAALLLLLVTLGWWIAPHPSSADTRADVVLPAEIDASRLKPDAARPAPAAEVARVEPAPPRIEVADPIAELEPDSDFARVSGRVLTATGSAVADVEVALLELEPSLFSGGHNGSEIVRAQSRTDAAGRFTLGRARPAAVHLLGIDPGGARGTMRVIERAVVSRELTEIGDVVLSTGASLSGRVVDERGAPLAGVRVRVLVLPAQLAPMVARFAEFAAAGVEQRSVWMTLEDGGKRALAIEDARITAALEKLPVPTIASDAQGEFALTDLAPGTAFVVADAPHRSPATTTIELGQRSNRIDALTVRRAQRVTGVVVDANGSPIDDAEVLVGIGAGVASQAESGTSPCLRAPRTDSAGRFALDDVPAADRVGVCARRIGAERWTIVHGLDPASELKITLEAHEHCALEVVDSQGRALATARATTIRLIGTAESEFEGKWVHADKQGRIELDDLRAGGSMLCVEAEGCESAALRPTAESSSTAMRVELAPANVCALSVVDTAKKPIAGAHVTLLGAEVAALERGVTDADGRMPLATWAVPEGTKTKLRVERAGFATRIVEFTEARPSKFPSMFTVELDRGGKLVLRGRRAGRIVPVSVALMRVAGGVQLATSDASGAAVASELPAGDYQFRVFEPQSSPDLLQWLTTFNSEEAILARGEATIEVGRTTELDVDVPPTATPVSTPARYGAAPSGHGRIEGLVTLDGAPAGGAHLHVAAYGAGRNRVDERVDADSAGRFVFDGIRAGKFAITASVDSAGRARKDVELADGQVQHVEFDLQSSALHIEVVGADGRAAPDVWVEVLRTDDGSNEVVATGSTGADGRLELALVQEGKFDAHAYDASLGEGRVQLEVGANRGAHELRIALERGVAFAGDVECSGVKLDIDKAPKLMLRPIDPPGEPIWIHLQLEGGVFRFSRAGMRAGRYSVVCWDGFTQDSRPIEITLGPQGDGALHLKFEFGQ